ncbi:MAG: DMT family transporter [Castellaniella sp.]|uniref:DMT family transporter n=1 Tax=Castellaniella sp. TaxID=1955812 RepID=UPI003A83855D
MDTNRLSGVWLGPLLMCTASLFFSVLDTGTKYLTTSYPVMQIVWVRYMTQALAVFLIFQPRMGRGLFHAHRYGIQLLRGLFLCFGSVMAVSGLARLPLAETTAIIFMAPVLITLLSGLVLKEKAGRLDWIAVACGFAGVLIIARPGGGLLTWGILFPLGTAICNACYQLVTRFSRSFEHPATSNLYTGLIGAMVLAPWGAMAWVPMAWMDMLLMICLGTVAALGHLIMTHALMHAPAATLGPYSYTQIFWATLMGWLVFSRVPDAMSWLGMLVIATGGLLLTARPLLHRAISAWRGLAGNR